jgi:hypothetical protein
MPTLSEEKRKDFLKQLESIKSTLGGLQGEVTKRKNNSPLQAPSATEFAGLNTAQRGGASGVGFETPENQNEIGRQVNATLGAGGSKSQAGEKIQSNQAQSLVRNAGLDGIISAGSLAGLTVGEASARIQEERSKRMAQSSAGTSGAFNQETIGKTRRAIDKFNFALNESNNTPFEHSVDKKENQKTLLGVTEKEIAGLFNSPEDLINSFQTNPEFQASLESFVQKGGTVEGIAGKISSPVTQEGSQDTQSFLSSLDAQKANTEVLEKLAPERELAQEEIARNQKIPEDMHAAYFGTEGEIGIQQVRKEQALARQRLLEEQEKDANRTAKDRARLSIEKNEEELKIQSHKIEENRLHAKNFMTARLAKLGALKTTGAAPVALATLEQRYQQQLQTLQSEVKFANRGIEIGLDEDLSSIENKTDSLILGLEEDLTNDNETVTKAILKAEQAAEKEVFKIQEKYAKQLRVESEKYTAKLKKEAEKFAKDFARTAAGGIDLKNISDRLQAGEVDEGEYLVEGKAKGVVQADGSLSKISLTPTQQREVESAKLRGIDTIRFFRSLPKPFRDLTVQEMTDRNGSLSFTELKRNFKEYQEEIQAEKDKKNTKQTTEERIDAIFGEDE